MGFSLSWLAVKNLPRASVAERLRLTPTGARAEFARADVSGQALPDGWYLLIARGCDHELIAESSLGVLSADAEVVACSVEEHVMFSSVECWRNGHRAWRVEHDAQKGIRHIHVQGSLPSDYARVLEQAEQQQDAEDAGSKEVDFFFDVPLQLAQEITDFKHDEENASLDDAAFEVFQSSQPAKRWWQRWR